MDDGTLPGSTEALHAAVLCHLAGAFVAVFVPSLSCAGTIVVFVMTQHTLHPQALLGNSVMCKVT